MTQIEANLQESVQSVPATIRLLEDDGTFPNNGKLPLVVYPRALVLPQNNPAAIVETLFERDG